MGLEFLDVHVVICHAWRLFLVSFMWIRIYLSPLVPSLILILEFGLTGVPRGLIL